MLHTGITLATTLSLIAFMSQYPYLLYACKEAEISEKQKEQVERIRSIAQSAAKKLDLKGVEVKFIRRSLPAPAEAVGNTFLPGGKTGIVVDAANIIGYNEKFVIHHELSHIKNNDPLKIPLVAVIVLASITLILHQVSPRLRQEIILIKRFPTLSSSGSLSHYLGLLGGACAVVWYSKKCELRADADAIKQCDEEEKIEALQFFLDHLIESHETKNGTLLIKEKENSIDVFHPPLYRRALQIWNSLETRNVQAVEKQFRERCDETNPYEPTLARLAQEGN